MEDLDSKELNNLHKAGQAVHFEPAKKLATRNEIMRFMNTHPLSVVMPVQRVWWRSTVVRRVTTVFASLVVIVAAGAGTTFAAQRALPGDPLYPFKVNVVEQVKGVLVFDQSAKIEQEISWAADRLQEVDLLAATGRLTPQAKVEAQTSLQAHVDGAQRRIAELQKNGKSEDAKNLAARLEATLSVHDQILSQVATENIDDASQLVPFQKSVSVNLKSASDNRAKLDDEWNKEKDAVPSEKISAAQNAIDKAKREIAKSKASKRLIAQAQIKLDKAQSLLDEAIQLKLDSKYSDSFKKADQAVLSAQEAIVLTRARDNSKLDNRFKLPLPPSDKRPQELKGTPIREGGGEDNDDSDQDYNRSLRIRL